LAKWLEASADVITPANGERAATTVFASKICNVSTLALADLSAMMYRGFATTRGCVG